jgi:hypothetical protein
MFSAKLFYIFAVVAQQRVYMLQHLFHIGSANTEYEWCVEAIDLRGRSFVDNWIIA